MMKTTPNHPRQGAVGAGLTLVELLASMAIASILLVAIASAMLLASRALPSKASLASQTLSATRGLDQMLAELRFALHISHRTASSVQFSLPDRDGDGKPELVKYAWSGSAGDPLVRTFNGQSATVLENLGTFAFTWDEQSIDEQYPGPPVEGAEQVLVSNFPADGTYNSSEAQVAPSNTPGQYFMPVLPGNAVSWRVTRVRLRAKQSGLALETLNVRLRRAAGTGLPTGSNVDSVAIPELGLNASSFGDLNVSFNSAGGLTVSEGACLIMDNDGSSSGVAGRIEFCNNFNADMLTSGDGTTFVRSTQSSLRYEVYGKIATPGTKIVRRTLITGVQVSAATTVEPANQLHSAVALLNKPEVLTGYWEADFKVDPTTIDLNAGGQNDWRSAAAFNPATLVAGRWVADQTLATNPSDTFTQFTTIEMRLEDTTNTGSGAGMAIAVDRAAPKCGIIEAILVRKSTNKQELKLVTRDASILPVTLATIGEIPAGPVSVNLYIKPSSDSFICTVNGAFQGEYSYSVITLSTEGVVALYPVSGDVGAGFDHIRVREGGTPQ